MNIEQVERYCDRFEQRLKSGECLTARQFLQEQQLPEEPPLLAELNKLERRHRTRDDGKAVQDAFDVFGPTESMPTTGTETGVDGYKLLQKIGEGGMGVVYMADQTHPVARRVALKIIKPGMDTKEVLARFEAERQALAMMDHPNIAHVLDAGTTDSGRPYFVMELVKGIPITTYCDDKQLSPRERLELFVPICQAVQHAHQKGIIHRDIKPSNILVAQYDDQAVPKIIDFGVAKAISQRLTDKTMFTQYGQIVGTIDYMSPEQATFNQLDVDTRSDIYSLGVLLYELLTGSTPFDKKRLRTVAFDELLRIIQNEEPPRPSTRLSSTAALPAIAVSRRTEPRKLTLLVRGELDWIVMKALEKDRRRRYDTATGLALDVQRYLNDEPVAACPPSVSYRLSKVARRNKVAVALGVALVLVLMSLAAAGVQAVNSRAVLVAKDQEEAQRQVAEQARDEADDQRQKVELAHQELQTTHAALIQSDREKDQYLYFNRIGLAEREWFLNNMGSRTRDYLEQCPSDKRGWEWHYLDRLSHDFTMLEGGDALFLAAVLTPDGSYAVASDYAGKVWIFDVRDRKVLTSFRPEGFQINCNGLSLSPDGKWLVAAPGYENLQSAPRIWDWSRLLREGESYQGLSLNCDTGAECNLSFSANGKWLAVSSGIVVGESGWVRVYSLEIADDSPPAEVWARRAEAGYFYTGVGLSPDGRFVAAGEQVRPQGFGSPEVPTRVFVWEWKQDREVARPVAHRGSINDVQFSPDGGSMASGAEDGIVKLWTWDATAQTLVEEGALHGHTRAIRGVAFEPAVDGFRVATSSEDSTIRIWDRRTGRERLTLRGHSSEVYDVGFRSDGRTLVSAGTDSRVGLWDIERLEREQRLEGHTGTIEDLAISADGRWAVSAGTDGEVRRWNLNTGESQVLYDHPDPAGQFHCVAISSDDAWIAAGEGDFARRDRDGILYVWNAKSNGLHFQQPDHNAIVWDVAFSPDGTQLATAGGELETGPGGINVWDVASRGKLMELPPRDSGNDSPSHPGVKGVGYSADALHLFGIGRTSSDNPQELVIRWDLTAQTPVREAWNAPVPRMMSVDTSPNRDSIVIGSWCTVLVCDAHTGEMRKRIPMHSGDVQDVAFSPDGRYFASTGYDVRIKLYNLEYEQEVLTLHGNSGPVFTLAFSPDGNRLYSAGADGIIHIWDATPRTHTD